MTMRPRRSVLYMPGSNARALEKAKSLAADCLILDLEDAVAPDAKSHARDQIAGAVSGGGYGRREVIVRVNDLSSEWGAADVRAIAPLGPDAVLVPKVNSAHEIEQASKALDDAGAAPDVDLWAMIETPLGVLGVDAIAEAANRTRLAAFVMGTNDLAKETGASLTPGRAPFLGVLMTCVLAARAHGLAILDGVFNDIANGEGFAEECAAGRSFGFDGKTLIHPSQIGPCNEIFAPGDDEIAMARKIVAAFDLPENRGQGVITVDGRMVELLHAEIARRTVAVAEAIAEMHPEQDT